MVAKRMRAYNGCRTGAVSGTVFSGSLAEDGAAAATMPSFKVVLEVVVKIGSNFFFFFSFKVTDHRVPQARRTNLFTDNLLHSNSIAARPFFRTISRRCDSTLKSSDV